jgi:hypothetical protein
MRWVLNPYASCSKMANWHIMLSQFINFLINSQWMMDWMRTSCGTTTLKSRLENMLAIKVQALKKSITDCLYDIEPSMWKKMSKRTWARTNNKHYQVF